MFNCFTEIIQLSSGYAQPCAIGQLGKISLVAGIGSQEVQVDDGGLMDPEKHRIIQQQLKLTKRPGGNNFIKT